MANLVGNVGASTSSTLSVRPPGRLEVPSFWFLLFGCAALAIPTLANLSDQTWSQESGAHGPIILATGAWLVWREKPTFLKEAKPGNVLLTLAILVFGIMVYIVGRAVDYITFQATGLYIVGLAIAFGILGPRWMLRRWFIFLYLAFAIPPPAVLLAKVTLPLKGFVSYVATGFLSGFGLPVSREGVTIFVAQYQLLVEDACSGMNSLVGLTAISLLYVYLRRGASLLHSLILVVFIVPIAVVANIVRIIALILMTYAFGDEVAQGILHPTAGLVLFALALMMIFGVDELIGMLPALRRRSHELPS